MQLLKKLKKVGKGLAKDIQKFQKDAPKRQQARIKNLKLKAQEQKLKTQIAKERAAQREIKAAGPQLQIGIGSTYPGEKKPLKRPMRFG